MLPILGRLAMSIQEKLSQLLEDDLRQIEEQLKNRPAEEVSPGNPGISKERIGYPGRSSSRYGTRYRK
jgi:hypothetical protein